MPIVFKDGKLLFTEDGKLAMSADCCCKECLTTEKTIKIDITYSLTQNQTRTTPWPSCADADAAVSRMPYYLLSFRPFEGQTESLSGVGEDGRAHKDMSKGDCETQTTPYLDIYARAGQYGSFHVTYEAVLVRAGILSASFTPQAKFNWKKDEQGVCTVTSIDYTNELLVETKVDANPTVQTSHNPSWNSGTWLYTMPYSATIPVRN